MLVEKTRVEIVDGREFVVHQLGPGKSYDTSKRGGHQSFSKGRGKHRSSSYRAGKLRTARSCRWCGVKMPAGTDALWRWLEQTSRYRYVCLPCGEARGYKVLRGGKRQRPRPQADPDQLAELRDHFQTKRERTQA